MSEVLFVGGPYNGLQYPEGRLSHPKLAFYTPGTLTVYHREGDRYFFDEILLSRSEEEYLSHMTADLDVFCG